MNPRLFTTCVQHCVITCMPLGREDTTRHTVPFCYNIEEDK